MIATSLVLTFASCRANSDDAAVLLTATEVGAALDMRRAAIVDTVGPGLYAVSMVVNGRIDMTEALVEGVGGSPPRYARRSVCTPGSPRWRPRCRTKAR